MNDQELDILFAQSAQNQKVVEQINRQVMQTVRRDMRRKAVRKWARLLSVCFGMPLMVLAYLWLLKTGVPFLPEHYLWLTFIVPVATLLTLCGKFLYDFSPVDL